MLSKQISIALQIIIPNNKFNDSPNDLVLNVLDNCYRGWSWVGLVLPPDNNTAVCSRPLLPIIDFVERILNPFSFRAD